MYNQDGSSDWLKLLTTTTRMMAKTMMNTVMEKIAPRADF